MLVVFSFSILIEGCILVQINSGNVTHFEDVHMFTAARQSEGAMESETETVEVFIGWS